MVYKKSATLYDELMAHAPYDEWVRFTKQIFRESGKEINHVLDLGCGTGEIAIQLAQSGYQMIGVDNSEEMLSYANYKASEANLDIWWVHQDIRSLQGLNESDAAISYCDVINYITSPKDIKQAFTSVHASLKDDGIFLFDVHDIDFVTEYYIGQTFADVTDEVSYIWFCAEGDAPGEMYHDLTFFAQVGDFYERFDEQHHQRTFPIEFYKNLLIETGFKNINIYADFASNPKNEGDEAQRIFFSAEKKSR